MIFHNQEEEDISLAFLSSRKLPLRKDAYRNKKNIRHSVSLFLAWLRNFCGFRKVLVEPSAKSRSRFFRKSSPETSSGLNTLFQYSRISSKYEDWYEEKANLRQSVCLQVILITPKRFLQIWGFHFFLYIATFVDANVLFHFLSLTPNYLF